MFIDPKAARKAQFAEILETMCEALELTPTQTEEAEKRYDAVGRWLGEDAILVGAWIYVHGSVALGTTTKPLTKAEFDVDLVCHVPHGTPDIPPAILKKVVGDRLKDHGTYVRLLEEMCRCWRLNYAGEFHMDITPPFRTRIVGSAASSFPTRNYTIGSRPTRSATGSCSSNAQCCSQSSGS
jgi:hypothetical protein